MLYEELQRRYGTHVSQRIKRELTLAEFNQVLVENLVGWLETRAEAAQVEYSTMLNNPLSYAQDGQFRAGVACRRWRDAEDLAYLVAIAEDVGDTFRRAS
jgi:hypothetical protein